MNFPLVPLTAAAVLGLLASCVPSTPQARIERNYSLYQSLPAKQQALVAQGRIAEGMSKNAVYLAWGNPSRKLSGAVEGKPFQRWDYTRLQPVNTFGFGGYAGWGRYYGYGRRGYGGYYYAPSVTYVPYRSATVWFHRNKVSSWERVTSQR